MMAKLNVTLKQRLDSQDEDIKLLHKTMREILDLLKGSSIMNTPGIIKNFQEFETKLETALAQMDHIERWRQIQISKAGTFTFKTANLFTRGLSVIGGLATLAAIGYTITQLIDWFKK
jgi:hypothetical protein